MRTASAGQRRGAGGRGDGETGTRTVARRRKCCEEGQYKKRHCEKRGRRKKEEYQDLKDSMHRSRQGRQRCHIACR
jgi:hypothetical protein